MLGGAITDHDQLAWLAYALTDTTVRDAAWNRMTPGHNAAHQQLWTTLARAAPGSLAAAPAAELGGNRPGAAAIPRPGDPISVAAARPRN